MTLRFPLLAVLALGLLALVRPAHADLLSPFHEKQVLRQRLTGTLTKTQFFSPALNGKRSVFLYTPPGFGTKKQQKLLPKKYDINFCLT